MVDRHQGMSEETPLRKGPSRDLSDKQMPGLQMVHLCRAEGKATDEVRKASKQWLLEGTCASMVHLPPEDGGEPGPGPDLTVREQRIGE